MEKRVILCIDGQSFRNPSIVGLAGEALDAIEWLVCTTDAGQCRNAARDFASVEEAWIVSCDDMEPLNVAAAVKRDDPKKRVYVVCCGRSGSMASRASSARVDALWSEPQFLRRFAQVKKACAQIPESESAAPSSDSPCMAPPAPQAPPKPSRRESQAKAATVIVTASGSGGCGKSSVAAILASLSAKAGLSTTVLDADLQFGDMQKMMGEKDPLRIEDAIAAPLRLDRMGAESRGKPSLVAAPRKLEVAEEIAPNLSIVLDRIVAANDVVVVNTGAFWSDVQAIVLDAADAVVFLMDSRPSSLHATVRAVELCARLGVATTSFTFAVNRHQRSSMLSAVDASCSLRGAHAVELPDGGRDVDELLGSGHAGDLIDSRNPFVLSLAELLARLLPAEKRDGLERMAHGSARRRRFLFRKEG